jgi:anthranilate phosphoribosyltransferase
MCGKAKLISHYNMPFLQYLHAVAEHRNLETADASEAMEAILAGEVSAAQIAAFLTALRMKGETVDELVGFARAMRHRAVRLDVGLSGGETLLDTCGTGGDSAGTFNISTIAAFVAAGAGVRVAKHGNRSASSQCGSADLLESLGIAVSLPPEMVARAIREVGIGFLFAPAVHTAMKHAHPVRLELKMRTVFNLLGPLTNPAGATAQLVGAPSERAAEVMAGALARLGLESGFVVHGSDGLDEITITGSTLAYEIRSEEVKRRTLSPEDFDVGRANASALKGADAETNAVIARAILRGAVGPPRDIVLVNASAALVAAGRATDFREGMQLARRSIDSGAAWQKVEGLARFGPRINVN